jgi:O-antigen ligase
MLSVFLSIMGLGYAFLAGNKNPAGLTVGFRIAMSVGAVLVPLCVRDREQYNADLDRILFLTMPLLVLGLTVGHWMFIAFGLIPYTWLRFKPRILALIPLAYAVRVMASLSSSLTGLGIILSSLIFLILLGTNRITNYLLRRPAIILVALALPIVLTVFVLRLPPADRFDLTSIQGYAEFKLLGDRKPVWDASWDAIMASPAIMPAGSVMSVYFAFLGRTLDWPEGSHNIFLEIGRQIGLVGMVSLTAIMCTMLYRTGRRARDIDELVLFYCFLAIYTVFGITGNSLVYDGVGAFYWLLVGQLYQTSFKRVREVRRIRSTTTTQRVAPHTVAPQLSTT